MRIGPEPPKQIPAQLRDAYTMGGRVRVEYQYEDGRPKEAIRFTHLSVVRSIHQVRQRDCSHYAGTSRLFWRALDKYSLRRKTVLVYGSKCPLYEAAVIQAGGYPITVNYSTVVSEDPRIKTMSVGESESANADAAISISTFEHDGLGRYGDQLNPDGDLQAMARTRRSLKPGGLLILAVPSVPEDRLVWNMHRIYGPERLPLLLDGWEVVELYPASWQPLWILRT